MESWPETLAKWERINTRAGEKRAEKREGEEENVKEKEGQVEQQGSELPYVDVQLCNVGSSRVYFMAKQGKWGATEIGICEKKQSVTDTKNEKREENR